jgi:hypothetical protein
MSKKKLVAFTAVLTLLVSTLLGGQFFNVTRGNMVPAYPLEIKMQSKSNVTYTTNSVSFDFEVVYYSDGFSWYSLDGRSTGYRVHEISRGSQSPVYGGGQSYFYELNFALSNGLHTFVVHATQDVPGKAKDASATVYFTINSTSISPPLSPSVVTTTPSPIPSAAIEPTSEPTLIPKQQTGFLGTNLPVEYGYAIIAAAVIAIVAVAAIALRKRHRKSLLNSAPMAVL